MCLHLFSRSYTLVTRFHAATRRRRKEWGADSYPITPQITHSVIGISLFLIRKLSAKNKNINKNVTL